jgi:hypothetical protein
LREKSGRMLMALVIVWPKVSLLLPQLISPEFLK